MYWGQPVSGEVWFLSDRGLIYDLGITTECNSIYGEYTLLPNVYTGRKQTGAGRQGFLTSVKNSTGNIENKEQNVQYLYLVCNDIRLNVSLVM